MNQNSKENLLKQITNLKINLDELKEQFFSDLCQQCFDIKNKIEDCEKKVDELENKLYDK